MKRIILAGLLLALILIVGCQKAVEQSVGSASETSSEEADLDNNLNELEELDNLDTELDVDFEEMEGYVK